MSLSLWCLRLLFGPYVHQSVLIVRPTHVTTFSPCDAGDEHSNDAREQKWHMTILRHLIGQDEPNVVDQKAEAKQRQYSDNTSRIHRIFSTLLNTIRKMRTTHSSALEKFCHSKNGRKKTALHNRLWTMC